MKANSFLTYVLLLFTLVITVFFHFKSHFSGVDYYKTTASRLEVEITKERLKSTLAKNDLYEYQQKVAGFLPQVKPKNFTEKTSVRDLASIVQEPSKEMYLQSSSLLFEKAKEDFRNKDFSEAKNKLDQIVEKYSDSVYMSKALFLLTETSYKQKDYRSVINAVGEMVMQIPENDLTGFALIRLAKVYQAEDRIDEALDIYQLIIKKYKNTTLQNQAKLLMDKII